MYNPWPKFEFGQFCTFRNGLNFTQQERGHTAKVVGVSDFWECNLLNDFSRTSTVSLSSAPSSDDLLRDGDLLFVRSNGNKALVGRCMLVFPGAEQVSFSGFTIRGRLELNEFNPYFISYLFQSDLFRKHLMKEGAGTNISNLNQAMLSRFIISKPTLPEQNRIVEILRAWDGAVEKIERLIATKKKQLLWLSDALLFGRCRLATWKTGSHQDHRWFSIPSDWACPRISEIAKQVTCTNTSGETLTVLSCTKHEGLVDSLTYFGRQIFSADTSAYKIVQRGQFAYATNHLEEGSIGYLDFCDKGLVSPMYTVFETDQSRVNDGFLWKLFKTDIYLHIFQANTSASVDRRGGLRWEEFGKLRVPLPSVAEQVRIDSVLSLARREIELLEAEKTSLSRQKRGLGQKLLTGELRVPLRDNEAMQAMGRAAEEVAQ